MAKLFVVVLVIIFGVFLVQNKQIQVIDNPVTPTPVAKYIYKTIVIDDDKYGYEIYLVDDISKLKIIANYSQKVPVKDLSTSNNCKFAINGGFYAEDDRPLGQIVIDSHEFWSRRTSRLFNGFLSFSNNQIAIGVEPNTDSTYVMQTGPLLTLQNEVLDLRLVDDKLSRRMFAAKISKGLMFGTVFNTEATILGPRLDDLPRIVHEIGKKENLPVIDAINLDGGRASAFYSDSLVLPEVTWVGSLFCSL